MGALVVKPIWLQDGYPACPSLEGFRVALLQLPVAGQHEGSSHLAVGALGGSMPKLDWLPKEGLSIGSNSDSGGEKCPHLL